MKLIKTENGVVLQFACNSCGQAMELKVESRLFECSGCAQVYQLKKEAGKVSLKAIKRHDSSPHEHSKKLSDRINRSSQQHASSDGTGSKNKRPPTKQYRRKSAHTGTVITSAIILSILCAAGMWWNELGSQDTHPRSASAGSVDNNVTNATSEHSNQDTHPILASVNSDQDIQPSSTSVNASTETVHIVFTQVKNIFEENCVSCHGAKQQKGKFRMDTLAAVLKGGSSGKPALIKGNAEKSLLYKLITLHANDDDRMPSDGDPLTKEQQALVKNWIEAGAPWEGTLVSREKAKKVFVAQVESPFSKMKNVDLSQDKNQDIASRHIDALIDSDLKAKGQQPGSLISDESFLRRAYLDIAGRIPTLEEYDRFFASRSSDRQALINELMESPGYVSSSHNYWLDALRVKESVAKNTFSTYDNWILQSIKKNMPFDQFAYELVAVEGRFCDPDHASAGYYLRDDQVGFMPEDSLSNTMQLFLATDMVCAQCHNHPYKQWTQKDFYQLLAFTDGTLVKGTAVNAREANAAIKILQPKSTPQKNHYKGYYKAIHVGVYKGGTGTIKLPSDYKYDDGKPNELVKAQVPFGEPVKIDYSKPATQNKYDFVDIVKKDDREDVRARMHFAKWITSPNNPMFTKTIVNRLWGRVFGSPLVGKNLDMAESDLGDNPNLTLFLVDLMKLAKYDQKVFMKILYKTKSYQRTALESVPDTYYHPAPVVKRLTAEQIWDSLLAIRQKDPDRGIMTGTLTERNVLFYEMEKKNTNERVEFIKNEKTTTKEAYKRYDMLERVSLSSEEHRASIMKHGRDSFLNVYGISSRGLIDGAIQEATIPQALHLMNDSTYMGTQIHKRQTSYLYDRLKENTNASADVKITTIYNAILTRNPTESEKRLATSQLMNGKNFDQETLVWALTNSHEFKIKR